MGYGNKKFHQGKYHLNRILMKEFSDNLHKEFDDLDGKKVYGKIIPISNNNYQISLITKQMMDQDRRFISLTNQIGELLSPDDENFLKGYHPFFFEFYVDKTKYSDEPLKKSSGKWKEMKIFFSQEKTTDKHDNYIHGFVIFAASPLKRKGAYLKFTNNDDEIDFKDSFSQLLSNGSQQINTAVRDNYIQLLNSTQNIYGIIWNVGQANCISLMLNQEETFFDIGLPVSGSIPYDDNNKAREHLKNSNPKVIILSHWDLDHILGVVDIGANSSPKDSYNVYTNCYWIVPDLSLLNNRSYSSERLCYYLLKQEVIWLVNHTNCNSPILQQNNISIWQGNGRNSNGGRKNNIGLIIKIDYLSDISAQQSVLLSGDCAYEAMPHQLIDNEYCLVISPHHGSRKTIPNLKAENHNARAVISVGENTYHHPDIEHISVLLKNDFRVYFTAGCNKINWFIDSNRKVHIKRY